jgi:hypothetical protein
MKEISIEELTDRFQATYGITNTQMEYLGNIIKMEHNDYVTNDAALTMMVEEVGFFIKEFIRSANMFRFTNDLLNKDRARVLNDNLSLIHLFFVFLLDEVHSKNNVFCNEDTLTIIFEAVNTMESSLEKYAKYVFQ